MPRLLACLVAALAAGLLAVSSAGAATRDFADPFDTLDGARWIAGDHALGRGWLSPANVAASGGRLALALPEGTWDGAEVRTRDAWRTGSFSAVLRAAAAPGSLTALFLYAPPDYASEVDVELVGTDALLSTYAGGAQTHTTQVPLGFDPAAGFHAYRIELGHGTVAFAVDGVTRAAWSTGVPAAPMSLYLNAWFPAWLTGGPAGLGQAALVERADVAGAR